MGITELKRKIKVTSKEDTKGLKYLEEKDDLSLEPGVNEEAYWQKDRAQRLKERKDIHKLRKKYVFRTFLFLCISGGAVFLLVFLSGSKLNRIDFYEFELPTAVLIALISALSIEVIGLFLVAAKWLFPSIRKK